MLCLVAILIAQNIYFLEKNNSTLSNIDKNYNRKLDVVMLMSTVVRERSLHMMTMYLSDDAWERDEIFTKFHKLKLVFLDLNNKLKQIGLLKSEKNIFDKIMRSINKTEFIQNDIVERIQSGGDDKVHSDISKYDLPLENEIWFSFDSLIEVIRNNADAAREDAKQQYREIINFIIIIAAFVFIIVILLMKKSISQVMRIESGLINEAEALSWDATHDALTNVYNRRWLEHKFKLLKNTELASYSLLYIDLDEFKPVNDNYGHVVGDKFLCGITREIEQCIRQNDTLARMGGDEFAILLENCDVEKAQNIAECIIKRVQKFSLLEGSKEINIAGCSIGISEFVTATASFDTQTRHADSACYEAKKSGKNRSCVFSGGDSA